MNNRYAIPTCGIIIMAGKVEGSHRPKAKPQATLAHCWIPRLLQLQGIFTTSPKKKARRNLKGRRVRGNQQDVLRPERITKVPKRVPPTKKLLKRSKRIQWGREKIWKSEEIWCVFLHRLQSKNRSWSPNPGWPEIENYLFSNDFCRFAGGNWWSRCNVSSFERLTDYPYDSEYFLVSLQHANDSEAPGIGVWNICTTIWGSGFKNTIVDIYDEV